MESDESWEIAWVQPQTPQPDLTPLLFVLFGILS